MREIKKANVKLWLFCCAFLVGGVAEAQTNHFWSADGWRYEIYGDKVRSQEGKWVGTLVATPIEEKRFKTGIFSSERIKTAAFLYAGSCNDPKVEVKQMTYFGEDGKLLQTLTDISHFYAAPGSAIDSAVRFACEGKISNPDAAYESAIVQCAKRSDFKIPGSVIGCNSPLGRQILADEKK